MLVARSRFRQIVSAKLYAGVSHGLCRSLIHSIHSNDPKCFFSSLLEFGMRTLSVLRTDSKFFASHLASAGGGARWLPPMILSTQLLSFSVDDTLFTMLSSVIRKAARPVAVRTGEECFVVLSFDCGVVIRPWFACHRHVRCATFAYVVLCRLNDGRINNKSNEDISNSPWCEMTAFIDVYRSD